MDQMTKNYTNIFHCKALKKTYPNWDFWFENVPSGWQPCVSCHFKVHSARQVVPRKLGAQRAPLGIGRCAGTCLGVGTGHRRGQAEVEVNSEFSIFRASTQFFLTK
jgi:hypothetical protein